MDESAVTGFAGSLGIDAVAYFDAAMLLPEARIRDYCMQNRCGKFGANHMCPPHIGSVEQIAAFLTGYRKGILLQYSSNIDVKHDKRGLKKTRLDFHRKILKIEKYLKKQGKTEVMGLIGGNCELCSRCKASLAEPCIYPGRARTSLEALAIDVMELRRKFGLDTAFHEDRITWTGCVLTE